MATPTAAADAPPPARRADARRNAQALLDAAGAVFVERGVDAPVREIAARAGVGMGTIYRHFPTRADLVVAVYRHQVEALAATAAELLAGDTSPFDALARWMDGFVDFLVTKHGLAGAMQGQEAGFDALHAFFLDRLVPAVGSLLAAAVAAGAVRDVVEPVALLRGAGNLCIGVEVGGDTAYDAHRMVGLLIAGLRSP